MYIVYSQLKRTAPKDFPSIDEMVQVVDEILPAMEPAIGEFLTFKKESTEINSKFARKELVEEDANKLLAELREKSVKYELTSGEDLVKVTLDKEAFGTLFQLFERWGKNWFGTIEDFVSFRKGLTETNSAPGNKEKED